MNFMKLQGPIKQYVKTNMSAEQMMGYIVKAKSVKSENIKLLTLPGSAKNIKGLSFFVVDEEKMKESLKDLLRIIRRI